MTIKVDEIIAAKWQNETLDALCNFVRVQALSPAFDEKWEENGLLLKAANDAAAFGRRAFPNATFEVLQETGRTPCLFFDIPATGEQKGSAVFYGHLDKQPPSVGWSEGREPFKPVIQDGRLYGRGCADDGYSVYTAFTALSAMEEAGIGHPRAYGIIETCEESGSGDLYHWIEKVGPRCENVRLVSVLDGSAYDYERIWVTTNFRGLVSGDLKVEMLSHGVHSGTASGVVPSTFMILRNLLDRFEDSSTSEVLDANCQTVIPPMRRQQLQRTAEIIDGAYERNYPWVEGARSACESTEEKMLAQCWKPKLACIGIDGIPQTSVAGNVLRPYTTARLSLRIPPHVDPVKAVKSMGDILTANPPFGAKVTFDEQLASPGWDAAPEQQWFAQGVDDASDELFGNGAAYCGDGASIPILQLLEGAFPNAQFFVTGVLGPKSNAHGPNEMLNLAYAEKLTCAVARLLACMP